MLRSAGQIRTQGQLLQGVGLQDPPTLKQVRHLWKQHRRSDPHQRGLTLSYIRGTSEKLARIFKIHGVRAYHKPSTSCTPSWSTPKTKHLITKSVASSMKSNVQNALCSMSVKLPAPWRLWWKTTLNSSLSEQLWETMNLPSKWTMSKW